MIEELPLSSNEEPIYTKLARWITVAKAVHLDNQELSFMRNAEFYIIEDIIRNQLIFGIRSHVLTEDLEIVRKEEKVPLTWWDMFKETYQRKWWMKIRNPIKYRVFTLQVDPKLLFPDTTYYPQSFGRVIRFTETRAWWKNVEC